MTKRHAIGLIGLIVLGALALVLAVAGGAAAWLFYTEPGLMWLTGRLGTIAGKGLMLDGVAGTLAGGASVQRIRYAGEDIEVRVTGARLRFVPSSLFVLEPRIEALEASELAVVTKPGEPRGRPPDTLELPVSFRLPDAHIARLVIDLGEGPLELTNVRLDYAGGRAQHHVRELSLIAFGHAVALRGTIDAHAPFLLSASVAAVRSVAPSGIVYATVSGNLSDITVDGGGTSSGARLSARARLQPYAKAPVSSLTAGVSSVDLKAFATALPRTAFEGEIALERAGELLAGEVRLKNANPGPYDKDRLPLASLRAEVRTDMKLLRFAHLSADLGAAGAVSGSGIVAATSSKLELHTKNLNLAGVHSEMRATQLRGRADIALAPSRQSLSADLAHQDIALSLVAHRAGDVVDIPRFRALARGGEASGKAHLEQAGSRPYWVEALFSRFDPAAWGNFPNGSINGDFTAKGTVEGPTADVRFALRDSRWLGAALAARGAASLTRDRLSQVDLEATLGANRIFARGALGLPRDVLSVRFDAPRLAVIDKRLQGALRGSAEVTGAFRSLSARFDVTGSDLGFDGFGRVKTVDARGTITPDPKGPVAIDAVLREIVTREWRLRSASVKLDGTRDAHTAVVQAEGERIDLRASARGGWREGTGWSGTILELANRGEVSLSLDAPVSLTVGPERVQVEPFDLRIIDGRLHVTALRYERGRLRTEGRFANLPVAPIVAITGAPTELGGTLRLTGSWSIDNATRLLGSVKVARESGDVSIGADRTMRLGVETLAVDASFTEQGMTFEARLRSALANASGAGRVTPVGSGANGYSGASALAFSATASIARLAPFAALIDRALLLDGEASAKLQGRGTLANPQITGSLTADRLAVALPAEGIDLKSGTLRAVLTEREVRVESFSIRGGEGVLNAQGTLARTGFHDASVDWRAQQFTLLLRPDRRLVVSGKGNAALREGKLAFTGALRADEGLFELATSSLPTLGDDVVIVGRKESTVTAAAAAPPAKPKKATRADVDVSIDLGNNVHVRGRGLDVWLAGELRVFTNTQGEIRAAGTVDARRGTFVAYGQRLEIDRGRFYFNGPVNNPGLDILAMRKRQAVEAGVAVTGTLTQPLVRVVSDPPLPEGEALSWLVLGRSPAEAGPGQLSALPLAAGAVMGKAGAPLARAFNLDEVSLRSGGADQFLTVGKRITERIYVVFEQGLSGAENLLRLEMSLTQRIALRAQAGTTSSLGLFYRYSWD